MNEKESISLRVDGMNCSNCALGISKALEKEGFGNIFADFAGNEVRFDAVDADRIEVAVDRIQSLGFTVTARPDVAVEKRKWFSSIETKFWFSAVFTVPLILAMFIPVDFLHNEWFQLALTIPVFIVGFLHFGRSAYYSLLSGVASMDVLIFLGSTAAFIYSLTGTLQGLGHDYMFYETSASIISIVLLGNLLEHRSVKRTTSAIDDLVQLQRQTARRITVADDSGAEKVEEVDASVIRVGDNILVNNGDGIPVDGEIFWGHCSIDESMITGEVLPVDRSAGDRVIGGTVLLSGNIRMRATAVGRDTTLSKIIEMVRDARKDKPALQNLADKISMIFVPVVVGLSLLTMLFWFFGMGLAFQDSLMRGIAVLVIACPCALGLAIPTAVVVGLGRSAKHGVLIRGGSSIDKMSSIDTIVFDKTGTLTTGNFRVSRFQGIGIGDDLLKQIVYSLEKHSSHPVARALVDQFAGVRELAFSETFEERGMGMSGKDPEGNMYAVGSYAMVSHLTDDQIHNVYVMQNGELVGWIDLDDEIRPEAAVALSTLREMGLKTILLSGDSRSRCERVAGMLGIEEVHAEKLPGEKLDVIESLALRSKVAMVGDGINDAPALEKALIGISLSDATRIAVKSAEVVLLKGNLQLLPNAFTISATTLRTIKENLFWAFFYNICAIPLAMAGFLTPIVAAGAMAVSDVVVVLNSLRLKKRKLR